MTWLYTFLSQNIHDGRHHVSKLGVPGIFTVRRPRKIRESTEMSLKTIDLEFVYLSMNTGTQKNKKSS